MIGYLFRTLTGRSALQKALRRHFRCRTSANIVTASREFPITSRVDVQTALQHLFAEKPKTRLLGIHWQMNQETLTLAHSSAVDLSRSMSALYNTMKWILEIRRPFAV